MRRLILDLQDVPLEVILKLAAVADYNNETGEIVFHPDEEQAREILAIVKAGLEDSSITEERNDGADGPQ